MRSIRPDVFLECPVNQFSVLDFHRFDEILKASAPIKDRLKRQLDLVLNSQIAEVLPEPAPVAAIAPPPSPGRAAVSFAKAKALLAKPRRGKKRRGARPADQS